MTDGSAGARRDAVVVGAHLDTPDHVLHVAADLAARLGAPLVCVHVAPDVLPYVEPIALSGVSSFGNGLDLVYPQPPAVPPAEIEARLRERLEPLLAGRDWRIVLEQGDPADALAAVVEREHAVLIVVGTQEGRIGVRDLFGVTTANHLAHRQHVPVVIVPRPA